MTELLIINEFSAGDLIHFNGMDDQGRLYQLEPFPTKLRGWQKRELRELIRERGIETAVDFRSRGILPVSGPFHYQEHVLLGWERREGVNLWNSPYTPGEEERLFRDVLGLISTYRRFHQNGLLVGQPVWERICRDSGGIYFPDPALVSGLAIPRCVLPPGLGDCHPPERFRGEAAQPTADIFYLGLLVFWLFTGELPYRLTRGWPTRAIMAGENPPFFLKRPDINPAIGRIIDSMLAVLPEERPTVQTLEERWPGEPLPQLWHSSLQEQAQCQGMQKAVARRKTQRFFIKGWQAAVAFGKQKGALFAVAIGAAFLLTGFILGSCLTRPIQPPVRVVRDFYHNMANPTLIDPAYREIAQDYLAERNQRLQAAREILAKPLVDLAGLRLIDGARTTALIRAEAELVEWKWTGAGWRNSRRLEHLVLKNTGSGWRIVARSH